MKQRTKNTHFDQRPFVSITAQNDRKSIMLERKIKLAIIETFGRLFYYD